MNRHDIGEDEIRIITPKSMPGKEEKKLKRTSLWLFVAGFVICAACFSIRLSLDDEDTEESIVLVAPVEPALEAVTETPRRLAARPYTTIIDSIVGGVALSIMEPHNAVPELKRGAEAIDDSTAVLIAQAADVRADNGEIAGAFVEKGILRSKGQSKSGFCAIIGGVPVIGVATTTPYLEEALDSEGHFFRQYPLVVGGQVVENKPRGRAVRRALAELNGRTVVVSSRDRLTFHDFSQALVDLGVNNAVYLVGGMAVGMARTHDGSQIEWGKKSADVPENINYIVWK